MEIGEFELIRRIRDSFGVPEGIVGIGDDCAIIPQSSGLDTLVSTDMLVEGTHFLLNDVSPHDLGWKSAAVNISDIAAMGGRPTFTFLSVAIPANIPLKWIDDFIAGYIELSEKYGVILLGGDTTSSDSLLCINVTVIGEIGHGRAKMRRSALPGDLICVTGTLGDSAGGLKVILSGIERDESARKLVERHYKPCPRVEEGRRLASIQGVHAMMDISDGIGSDLRHILKESGAGAEIHLDRLPVSKELSEVAGREDWNIEELAASGGEDYELLFTIAPESESLISDLPYSVIGVITDGTGIRWTGGKAEDYSGFRHF